MCRLSVYENLCIRQSRSCHVLIVPVWGLPRMQPNQWKAATKLQEFCQPVVKHGRY